MKKITAALIKLYHRNSVRFWLSAPLLTYSNCKFQPTCSEYTAQSIDKFGLLAGLAKGILRTLRCNPFSKGGVDLP